jgi:chitin disaccharide deacetylase
MTKRLIVNGDDFGISPGVNAGLVRAHREGILSSASLMVDTPYRA